MFGWFRRRKIRRQFAARFAEASQHADSGYNIRTISKKTGGNRTSEAPVDSLKMLQRQVLRTYLSGFTPAWVAHGFIKRRSPTTAARPHAHARVLVVVDILNFFPSVTVEMLRERLPTLHPDLEKDPALCELILSICTLEGRLPQGAPTSPALSNIIFKPLDEQLRRLAVRNGARYTRYADDCFFSSRYNQALPSIIHPVTHLLAEAGFTVNRRKTRVLRGGARMVVAGVVINNGVSIGRKRLRSLRAALHNFEQRLSQGDQYQAEKKWQHLRGLVAYYQSINPHQVRPYLRQLRQLAQEHRLQV